MRLFRRGESASTLDLLVVGLGNPGREHARDRHNAGWMVVDELARRHDGSFRSKFSGQLAEVRVGELKLALLKPETYMNLSGNSLAAAARFFKLPTEQIAVVHDDVDLDPGRIQVRLGGGLAGHNGLRSIRQALGSAEFLRVRAGVGRPGRGDRRPVADYVLSPFAPEDDAEDADLTLGRRRRDARRRGPRRGPAPLQLGERTAITRAVQGPFGACTSNGVADLRADERRPERRVGRHAPGDARDLDLEAAAALVLHLDHRADADDAVLGLLDDDGVLDSMAQDRDPPLEQALLVLGVVIREVLGEVAEAARGCDRLDELRPLRAFQLGELRGQRIALSCGHRLGCPLGHGSIMADFSDSPHTLARR